MLAQPEHYPDVPYLFSIDSEENRDLARKIVSLIPGTSWSVSRGHIEIRNKPARN